MSDGKGYIQRKSADGGAMQVLYPVTRSGDHPFDLMVFALRDDQRDLTVRIRLTMQRAGDNVFVAQRHAVFQSGNQSVVHRVDGRDMIGLGDVFAW